MIIEPDENIQFSQFLNNGERIDKQVVEYDLFANRVVSENTSFGNGVNANANGLRQHTVISHNWFNTTLPNNVKMAKHTYTIATYTDETALNKIGEITFGAILRDHGQDGIILEGEGFEQLLNVQILHTESTFGIYNHIKRVVLLNFLFFGLNLFAFVKDI